MDAMDAIEGDEGDRIKAAEKLWVTYAGILAKRGIDLDKVCANWVAHQTQKLASPGARDDFDELCSKGCAPQVLATIIALFGTGPKIEEWWTDRMGSRYKREKFSRDLEKAALAVEKALGEIIAAEDDELRSRLAKIDRISPSRIVSEIRIYRHCLTFAEQLAAEVEARSIKAFAKYLLTAYVKRATGTFSDRVVSGLLAEIVGPNRYVEVTHRMWRHRHQAPLQKYCWVADLLFVMGLVIIRRT